MIRAKSDGGWIVVFVALSLVVLCGFVALAIDVGSFLSARTSVQRAADAGALAGAFAYVTEQNAADQAKKTAATDQAKKTAASNQVMGANIREDEVTVEFPPGLNQIKVTTTHNAPIFFAKVLGMTVAPISATAIAEAATQPYSSECVKPLFIPNTIHATGNPCNECNQAVPQVLINGSGAVTSFGLQQLWIWDKINVKSASDPLYPLPAGMVNVFATTFGNDTPGGTLQYGKNISGCPSGVKISCNSTYQLKSDSGLNSATLAEFTKLVNANGSPADTFDPATHLFKGPDGNKYNTSHQLITVPIFDVCTIPSFCPAARLGDPNREIKVVGFARVFAQIIGVNVRFTFVGLSGCGTIPPNSPETGPYGYPVRLVHN
jgi:Flp pilus assembly protein TadG